MESKSWCLGKFWSWWADLCSSLLPVQFGLTLLLSVLSLTTCSWHSVLSVDSGNLKPTQGHELVTFCANSHKSIYILIVFQEWGKINHLWNKSWVVDFSGISIMFLEAFDFSLLLLLYQIQWLSTQCILNIVIYPTNMCQVSTDIYHAPLLVLKK